MVFYVRVESCWRIMYSPAVLHLPELGYLPFANNSYSCPNSKLGTRDDRRLPASDRHDASETETCLKRRVKLRSTLLLCNS